MRSPYYIKDIRDDKIYADWKSRLYSAGDIALIYNRSIGQIWNIIKEQELAMQARVYTKYHNKLNK